MYRSSSRQRDNRVVPLGFKTIQEDEKVVLDEKEDLKVVNTSVMKAKLKPNFTFEFSYPAVVFEKICFHVNKSQQQANIVDELLYRVKDTFNCFGKESTREKIEILKSINLSVPCGSIFGLLGPSSCGKTTLLRCLVGLLNPSSGNIRLFCQTSDNHVGDEESICFGRSNSIRPRGCKIPGSNVGYMPQDLGLYEDFTIRQLLTMFGRYMKMTTNLIKSRIDFMSKFLDLPSIDRVVGSLSGGQKRRVSFAIACLHMPPLIILDEPTVGVDPLLRQSIWKYLRRLADTENKTIIITTHYIEEAAQADQVAFMRAGQILVQDTPTRIMESNKCKTLEEAFLKICNDVNQGHSPVVQKSKLYPQPRFNWFDKLNTDLDEQRKNYNLEYIKNDVKPNNELIYQSKPEKLISKDENLSDIQTLVSMHDVKLNEKTIDLSTDPNINSKVKPISMISNEYLTQKEKWQDRIKVFKSNKLTINGSSSYACDDNEKRHSKNDFYSRALYRLNKNFILIWALLYKNYRRNVNSLPLLAFQFMLPVIQMVSFSLCVGGRPTNIGLGLVNLDNITQLDPSVNLLTSLESANSGTNLTNLASDYDQSIGDTELLSNRYLSFVDKSMINVKPYSNLEDALMDVRKAKLWAAMEIGENFTSTILKRFDLENFYQLEPDTIRQSVIKLYPDRSNKVLDMICHRSLITSFRSFMMDQFDHFKRLPIEMKEPIFTIEPNLISNSIDGYTESIAAGLLASLTYIMAAGLTTFIMVVERVDGILERTFTSGISPVAYLVAHAVFRSFVMMLQIAVVMFLTFYLLRQPLVGSIWLAYLILMTLNLTGITYGLLISSLVTDQNGAALTIVSSLVVKITLSGILWPFEAIPYWLRTICYIQPLTMPIQALKAITLKGSGLGDRTVQIGFLIALSWLALFLTIATKRFKFYQF